MNNQKIFLIIAILLSIFLLNEQWDRQHAVDANGNLIYQADTKNTDTASISKDANVPSAIRTQPTANVPTSKQTHSGESITVNTDLLTLEISQKGGYHYQCMA